MVFAPVLKFVAQAVDDGLDDILSGLQRTHSGYLAHGVSQRFGRNGLHFLTRQLAGAEGRQAALEGGGFYHRALQQIAFRCQINLQKRMVKIVVMPDY